MPSLANFLCKLRLLRPNCLPDLRLSLFAGEALPMELARTWAQAAAAGRIFNLYGPTECTIFATHYEYTRQEGVARGVVPIGKPLPGLRAMIVDEDREVVAEEVPGELWLSGAQLAQGYWNNDTATRAAFVRFSGAGADSSVWYRTGDLVSRRGTELAYHGRLDRQIKLRGFRIELQEIESVIREVACCAMVAVTPVRNAGGLCEKIVAYCDATDLDEAEIKARCAMRLPHYSVPERILRLEVFPVSANGKIDYRALSLRALASSTQPADPSRS